MNLRENPAVCEQTCLFFLGAVSILGAISDHRWLDSDQQYYFVQVDELCNYHQREAKLFSRMYVTCLSEYKTLYKRNGKVMFRNFLAKMECKNIISIFK